MACTVASCNILYNDTIIKKTLFMAKINHIHLHQQINSGNRKRVSATIVPQPQVMYQPQPPTIYQPQTIQTPPQNLPASRVQRPRIMQQNWKSLIVVYQPIPSSVSQTGSRQRNSGTGNPQNLNSQNYLSLLVIPEDALPSNQKSTQKQQTCISNILPATVTNDKLLDAIFSFELEELSNTPLFSGAVLEEKPITTMYTDAKIDGHHIKLILNSGSAGSIIT
ncbi:hypothetical protein G9A89_018444 [Geosiphon pyriformis]|nr:hypothetical protein G9A89_018444 [Geosiphon pyriformis]